MKYFIGQTVNIETDSFGFDMVTIEDINDDGTLVVTNDADTYTIGVFNIIGD